MAYKHHLISLYNFLLKEGNKLEIVLLTNSAHGIQKDIIVSLWQLKAREQVRNDAIEEWYVVGQEFG